jgi:hypothetical protein
MILTTGDTWNIGGFFSETTFDFSDAAEIVVKFVLDGNTRLTLKKSLGEIIQGTGIYDFQFVVYPMDNEKWKCGKLYIWVSITDLSGNIQSPPPSENITLINPPK